MFEHKEKEKEQKSEVINVHLDKILNQYE